MLKRLSVSALSLIWLPAGLLAFHSVQPATAADSKIDAHHYGVKAGIKRDDHVYSVPIDPDAAPIVEVHQSNGQFDTIIRDKDIHFKTGFRVECGKGWTRSGDLRLRIEDERGNVIARNLGITEANTNYSYMKSVADNFVDTSTMSSQQACNNIVQDRIEAGVSVKSLLKHGFWTKIDQAYPVTLSYQCKTKRRSGMSDIRSITLRDWQPLFIRCVGDPDHGKTYAKTSKKNQYYQR